MPCRPARARILLRQGRAVKRHVNGFFCIKLVDRTLEESAVKPVALNVNFGSKTTGIAVVSDKDGVRRALALRELHHRGQAIKATLHRRAQFRRNRRGQLRYRAPRFDNRAKPSGWLPPSVRSLIDDTMRLVNVARRLYPITLLRLKNLKFDPRLLLEPTIRGIQYQRGTLWGRQLRAYVLERDEYRCIYCGKQDGKLELDHVIPRGIGTDRVDNLVAACHHCNQAKGNRPLEKFLHDKPALLAAIKQRLATHLTSAAHINTALPTLRRVLLNTLLPVQFTDSATVAHRRAELNVPNCQAYNAALQGYDFTTIQRLPETVLALRPNNGQAKQKANVDRHGTPVGRPFREQQRLPRHLRRRNPAAGHSGKRQRHGPQLIATGDTVQLTHHGRVHTGRAVIKNAGNRVAIHAAKPQVSAKIDLCRRLARNPGWTIRRSAPS